MPSIIEENKKSATTEEEKRAMIREEIISYVREYLNSEEFTGTIKKNQGENITPSIIEEIKKSAATEEEKRAMIREEIISYFREYLNSEAFTKTIKSWCQEAIRGYGHNYTSIDVAFWDYNDGCSSTHFRIGAKQWRNPEESSGWSSRTYKGIELRQLQNDVGPRLMEMTKSKLIELGFKVWVQDKESWLKYYHKEITLSW